MVEPDKAQLAAVMIRRLKSELLRRPDGSQRFAERRILSIEVPYSKSDREAHAALKRYGELRLKKASETGERFATELCLKLLKNRGRRSDKHGKLHRVYELQYMSVVQGLHCGL